MAAVASPASRSEDDRLPAGFKKQSMDTLLEFKALHLHEEIGRGAFSRVYRGTYHGHDVAVKRMPVVQKDAEKYLTSELAILKSVHHPNLIKYYGAAFQGKEVFVVTEFMNGGDLSTIVSQSGVPLSWLRRCRLARDILAGIVALHEAEVVHRDIKTENILVDDDWRCVVADYGFARKASKDFAMTICGTDEFMAPEVIFGEVYDERADVFSFGVILWELMYRTVPGKDGFMQRGPRTKFTLDLDALRAGVPADAPTSLVELAVQCCTYEPEYRQPSEEALEWLTALVDELAGKPEEVPPPPAPSAIKAARAAAKAGARAGSMPGTPAGDPSATGSAGASSLVSPSGDPSSVVPTPAGGGATAST